MDSVDRYRQERARKHRLLPAESLSELRNTLTEAEMQENYNAFMEATARPVNCDAQMRYLARAQIYAEELMRRETVRLRERMQRLIITLVVLVILATIMSVILSTLTLSFGG
jgi:DNA replication protein DnaC